MTSEISVSFPFSPELKPGRLGPIYEYRHYTFRAGALPNIIERWGAKLPGRLKLSPVALAGHIEMGVANKFVHIWPYASLEQRGAIRDKACEPGVWPPPGGADDYFTEDTKIMLPAAFSPMQ